MTVVRFLPRGVEFRVPAGTTLLEAARAADQPLACSCESRLACGWCIVRVVEGAANLTPVDSVEAQVLQRKGAGPGQRLACGARLLGPVSVTTTYW